MRLIVIPPAGGPDGPAVRVISPSHEEVVNRLALAVLRHLPYGCLARDPADWSEEERGVVVYAAMLCGPFVQCRVTEQHWLQAAELARDLVAGRAGPAHDF